MHTSIRATSDLKGNAARAACWQHTAAWWAATVPHTTPHGMLQRVLHAWRTDYAAWHDAETEMCVVICVEVYRHVFVCLFVRSFVRAFVRSFVRSFV